MIWENDNPSPRAWGRRPRMRRYRRNEGTGSGCLTALVLLTGVAAALPAAGTLYYLWM